MTSSKAMWEGKLANIRDKLPYDSNEAMPFSEGFNECQSILLPELLRLQEALDVAGNALEFYAPRNRGTYSHPENATSDLEWDDGLKAREALAKIREARG